MAKIVADQQLQLATASTTAVAPIPPNVEDDLVVCVAVQDGLVTTDITINESFTTLAQSYYAPAAGREGRVIITYKVAGSGGITTAPTFTSPISDEWVLHTLVIRGADTADLIDVTSSTAQANGSYTATGSTVTTTEANCLVLSVTSSHHSVRDNGVYPVNNTNFHHVGSQVVDNSGKAGLCIDWSWQASTGATTAQTFYGSSVLTTQNIVFAINDSGDGYIPPHSDIGTQSSKLIDPLWSQYFPVGGGDHQPLSSYIPTVHGLTTANGVDTLTYQNSIDAWGTGKYWTVNSSSGLGALNYVPAATKDFTWGNGLFYTAIKALDRETSVRTALYQNGGISFLLYDNQADEEHISWYVASGDSKRSTREWCPVLIQVDNAQNTDAETYLTPDLTNIEGIAMCSENTLGTNYPMATHYTLLNKLVLAGGSSTLPIEYDGLWNVIKHTVLPYGERLGEKAFLVYIPIVIGGGAAVYVDLDGISLQYPKAFDEATLDLNVHVADNKLGLTLDGNTGDVITITNSLLAGASKWHFAFASGAAGTYDLSGTTVSNAGTVTLRDISQDLSGLTFSECDKITLNGCDLVSSTITKTTDTHGLEITSATECADLNNLTFIDNTNGHSIKITATGTYTFDNFQFSGGGVDKRSFVTGSGVNGTTDIVTTDAAHGYTSGDAIYYQKHGGTQAIGLTDSTLYYVNAQSSTTLSFHTTQANAIAGTSKVDLTSGGSETHYIYSSYADVYNASGGAVTINITNGGSTPTVRNSSASSTTVSNSVTVTVTALDEAGDPIENARVLLEKVSDGTDILTGLTNASGVATTSFAYVSTTAITGWVRKSSSSPYYKQALLAGNITASGYDQTVTLVSDE